MPMMKQLTPKAIDSNKRCFLLSMKSRLSPFLILSVSISILNDTEKHKANTIHFDNDVKRCMKVPPSRLPREYITPCPKASMRANINLRPNCKLLTFNCSLLMLKAVEATATGNVKAIMNSMLISILESDK